MTYSISQSLYLSFFFFAYPVSRSKTTGKGVFGIGPVCMTFTSLASISPDAETLQDNLRNSFQDGVASGKFTPALGKQL